MSNEKNYKIIAIIGIILMGIGSFLSCLAQSNLWTNAGIVCLCIGVLVSIVGFSKWQP